MLKNRVQRIQFGRCLTVEEFERKYDKVGFTQTQAGIDYIKKLFNPKVVERDPSFVIEKDLSFLAEAAKIY